MPAGISATASKATNNTSIAATTLALASVRHGGRPRRPSATSSAPGTNATHHNIHAVACRLLAGVHASMGFAQLMAGADADARASFSKERSAVRRLPGLAILAHRAGDRVAADAALAALVAEYGDKSHYQYAQIHAQWGDAAKALASLQAAWDLRDGGIMLMYADPLLASLRDTAGYLALAKAVGFT